MKKIILTTALAALFTFVACSPQAQAPQVDDQANERPETVIVHRDEDGGDGQSGNQPNTNQNDAQGGSQSDSSQGGGAIIEDRDEDDINDLDADDNMQSGQQLPEDFPVPVPDDFQVQAVGNVGNETSAVLEAPSGEDAYNYYRQALADAGFRVVDEGRNQSGYFDAELEFSNNDLEGNIDFNGNTIEIDIERYG
ncbi:MAG: hypothetical protein H0U65_10570 [Rubrobacter sp.]|jgi:hypothetical protein|nr:hypothetical protein [Rubrobacter sp.]